MIKSYLNELNNYQESDVRKKMRSFAEENDYPIINLEGLAFLKQIIKMTNAKNILEIGSCIGYSSISMAELGVNVTTIEINKNTYDIARKYIDEANQKERITLINGDALEIDLRIIDDSYDLIFIDAAKAQYVKFFEKYTPLLRKGGVVFTDNLLFHNLVVEQIKNKNLRQLVGKIKKFNEFIVNKEGYDTHIYDVGDGIAVSIKEGE